jgi:FkbM family methyltransferase
LKKILKYILNSLNYTVIRNELIQNSDDPIQVVSNILDINEVKIIVDGGASIGDTSKKLSDSFQNAVVHAFEPFTNSYQILKENFENHKRIIPSRFALSNTSKSKLLNINASEGTNSLLNTAVKKTHPHYDLLETKETILVESKPLDILFPDETIDLLKLDLQGGEYDALHGAEHLLKQNRIKCIICEVMFQSSYKNQRNGSELLMFLEKHGFKIFNFYQNHSHLGKLLQSDVILYHQTIEDKVELLQKKNFMSFTNFLRIK